MSVECPLCIINAVYVGGLLVYVSIMILLLIKIINKLEVFYGKTNVR